MTSLKPKVIITAGGTREPVDPVRYVGNRSSGKMGVSVLLSCLKRGYPCVFIHTGLSVPLPGGDYRTVRVETAEQMRRAVIKELGPRSILVMAAAVADFRPVGISKHKIKKDGRSGKLVLELEQTPDILSEVGRSKRKGFIVIFTAETRDLLKNSLRKMKAKNADLLVANDVSRKDAGFGSDFNRTILVTRSCRIRRIGRTTKDRLADIIMDAVEAERQ